jgi:hypothetical protein
MLGSDAGGVSRLMQWRLPESSVLTDWQVHNVRTVGAWIDQLFNATGRRCSAFFYAAVPAVRLPKFLQPVQTHARSAPTTHPGSCQPRRGRHKEKFGIQIPYRYRVAPIKTNSMSKYLILFARPTNSNDRKSCCCKLIKTSSFILPLDCARRLPDNPGFVSNP